MRHASLTPTCWLFLAAKIYKRLIPGKCSGRPEKIASE